MLAGRPRVLVVDDEVEVTFTLQAFFQKKGYEMVTAFEGTQAIACLQAKPVDLLLLDVKMPGMTGVEVLHYIKAKRVPTRVIVITAFDDEYRGVVEQLGVHGFLNKPFGIAALSRIVEQVLQHPLESSLPVTPGPVVTTVARPAAMPQAKLLLLEPSEYLFKIKRVFFESSERCGGRYQVESAYSAVEALEKLHAFQPEMVLVDLLATGALGDLATQLLRSAHHPKEIIVHGQGTVSHQQQVMASLTEHRGVQLVMNETFTEAGLQRLNGVVRDVALHHGLTA